MYKLKELSKCDVLKIASFRIEQAKKQRKADDKMKKFAEKGKYFKLSNHSEKK